MNLHIVEKETPINNVSIQNHAADNRIHTTADVIKYIVALSYSTAMSTLEKKNYAPDLSTSESDAPTLPSLSLQSASSDITDLGESLPSLYADSSAVLTG